MIRKRDVLFWLSEIVPVRMRTNYRVAVDAAGTKIGTLRFTCTWWQWRRRCWRVHQKRIKSGATT